MPVNDCNADEQANALFTSLTADSPTPPTLDMSNPKFDFEIDSTSDLYSDVTTVDLTTLTEVAINGEGVFDKLMQAMDEHIQREYKGNRITGDQYAKVYTEVATAVLGQSVAFVLQKDQAKWAAITAQMQARIAQIQATEAVINLEKTKVETQKAIFDMENAAAQYGLTKMEIANSEAKYCLTQTEVLEKQYNVEKLLPADLAIKEYERMQVLPSSVEINKVQSNRVLPAEAENKEFINRVLQPIEESLQLFQLEKILPTQEATAKYQLEKVLPVTLEQEEYKLNQQMPAQTDLIKEQRESERAKTMETRSNSLTPISGVIGRQKTLLNEQINLTSKQIDLTVEQKESERSKTMDTRSDGSTIIKGSVGKQKDLYNQQIDSFVKDAKQKAAKMYLDGWITQKTLDENLAAPTQLNVPEVSAVLLALRNENGL